MCAHRAWPRSAPTETSSGAQRTVTMPRTFRSSGQSPAARTARYPKVPWSNIAKMRDLIGHHYYRRDPQIILATIREPLTQLRAACKEIVPVASDQTDTKP